MIGKVEGGIRNGMVVNGEKGRWEILPVWLVVMYDKRKKDR